METGRSGACGLYDPYDRGDAGIRRGAYVFGHQLLGIYTSDAEVIQCGMEILLYTTVTYFLCGLMDLFPGSMRGMGYSLVPMITL